LVRKFNTTAYKTINNVILGPDDTTFIYNGEDNLIKIAPVFPNEHFKNTYQLKGHKGRVLAIK